jgi:predicted MFS family arabinose efflux permease
LTSSSAAFFNAGNQSSQVVGGYVYDWLGYEALVLLSAAFTAVGWFLVPLVKIDRIEAKAKAVLPALLRSDRLES